MQKLQRALRALAALSAALALAGCLSWAARRVPGGGAAGEPGWLLTAAAALHRPGAVTALWLPAAQTAPPAAPAAAELVSTPESAAPQAQPSPTFTPQPLATPVPRTTDPDAAPSGTPAPTATVPPMPADAGPVVATQYSARAGSVKLTAGSIANQTAHDDSVLAGAAAQGGLPFTVELNSDEPQVLILHTHATETYQPWAEPWYDPDFTARTLDRGQNMCAVGDRMAEILNAAGVNTLHDTTLHDSPSYTESYRRSAATARAYLERYPSIKVILDVHRDAIEADGARVKPLAQVEGADTAQVMIIAGCDNGGSVPLPNWQQNLRFAAAWEAQMESLYPGLTRPVLCGYRFYNQDVTTGSLLIEVGGHANTLQEALRAGEYAAKALAELFGAQT